VQVKTQKDDIQIYLSDASNLAGGEAETLFIPETIDDIAKILRDADAAGTPVTISGARTGTVGGAIPFGGIIVSLEKLNRIKTIDKAGMFAVVEPGVILGDLQAAIDNDGLFYPPDPTEWSCQIGGTVATNASGARSFKYGATREFVRRLTVVLASGEIIELRRGELVSGGAGQIILKTRDGREVTAKVPTYERPDVRKNVSGYYNGQPLDAIDIFIGSEGTLGVIAEIELALLPKPEAFFSGIVFFQDGSQLLSFVEEAKSRSFVSRRTSSEPSVELDIDATLIEYFDSNALRFIAEKFPETPSDAAGAVFFEQEATAESEDTMLELWNDLLERHGADLEHSWFTTNVQDRDRMRSFRHALPVAVNERITRYKQRKVGTDMAVPDEKFAGFLRFYNKALSASGIDYVIFGHIGDCHLHANLLPKDEAEAEKARHIYGRCVAQAIMLGGTVSAEHGIGKLKRKYLAAMMGERYLNEMAELKRAFDPNGMIGRGNIFEEKYLD
jgi:D-lactate dehydrogenase (cytochrome)